MFSDLLLWYGDTTIADIDNQAGVWYDVEWNDAQPGTGGTRVSNMFDSINTSIWMSKTNDEVKVIGFVFKVSSDHH